MKSKILVVEDEEALLLTLKEYLLLEYNVFTAKTGRQAQKEIKEMGFKAAIIDLHLPDINGLKVIQSLREKSAKTAILVLTSDKTSEMVSRAIEFGADDYIVKPVDRATLLGRVNKAILKRAFVKGD